MRQKIFKNPNHWEFIPLASLLLARKNTPSEVFKKYIQPLLFCKYWPEIKKRMRQDKWNQTRIIFWEVIYEKLLERYRKRGIKFREERPKILDTLCKTVGEQIQKIRKEKGLSQKQLGEKLGISQQLISRIEKGKENVSLITLKNISEALKKRIEIKFY